MVVVVIGLWDFNLDGVHSIDPSCQIDKNVWTL